MVYCFYVVIQKMRNFFRGFTGTITHSWLTNQSTCIDLVIIQYRSKVSYHPSSCFSRDKPLVSREPLKRIFWNKLQAISLWENDEFLVTRWSLPVRASGISGIVLHATSREMNVDLQVKSLNGKDKLKINVKDVHDNLRSAVTSLYFCIAAYWLRIKMNDSFWMETCFARPNTIIANEGTGWKKFL